MPASMAPANGCQREAATHKSVYLAETLGGDEQVVKAHAAKAKFDS